MARKILPVLLVLAWLAACCDYLYAQAEVPVLADAAGNPQAMMLIDDSGSMNAIVEHEDFDIDSTIVQNAANDIPSVIFRLESGTSAPTTAQTLRPVLIEVNDGFNDSSTGNLYGTTTLSNASTHPITSQMTCNTTSGSQTNCPSALGPTTPQKGTNAANLYGSTTISGNAVYAVANLAKYGAVTVTDTSGHEYLYIKYKKEDRNRIGEDWSDVWANVDASGNNQFYSTTAFSTTGGTVKFNNRQVFLAAGWYRIEYLRWIFYEATATQYSNLPGKSRLKIVKDVVNQLITDNPTVKFGLASLNGYGYTAGAHSGNLATQWNTPDGNPSGSGSAKIRKSVGTASATLITSLNTMSARGGTPLTNTYIEVLRYFHGESDNDPNFSGTYTSPINSACDAYFVVVLTDGLPTSESSNSMFGSSVLDYDGDGTESAASNASCSSSVCAEFFDDAAYFAKNNDFKSSLAGVQSLTTYVVGLALNYQLLDDVAEDGGTGHAFTAYSAQEITDTLQNIVTLIITSPVAGAGAALAETFGDTGKVYRPRFRADTWNGNIDVFNYNTATDSLDFQFDMGDLLEARDITANPRTIIAGIDTDFDGNTNTTVEFTTANATTLRPQLFRLFDTAVEDVTLLEPPLADYTQDATAETLINFIHGNAITDLRVRDRDLDGLIEKLGDIVYSRPVEIGPKNGNYTSMTGYNAFTSGLNSQPRILLVGANDGMLHAFSSETGEELWAYIPASQLPYLERLSRTLYNANYRRSYVDGPISVEDVYINGQWRTICMFGLRTGGSGYTVLDITDRTAPTLLYEVSSATSGGQSWSKPVVVPFGGSGIDPSSFSWYMVVGTGEGKTTAGTNILAYNLNTTTPPSPTVISLSSTDAAGTRTSTVTASQNDADFNADRLYVGTEEGDLFRVRVNSTVGAWTAAKVYDGTTAYPIVAQPLAVLVDNPQYNGGSGINGIQLAVGIYFGTGRYDDRSDITGVGATSQRIIGIFDPVVTTSDAFANVLTNQTTANFQNQSVSTYTVRFDSDKIYRIPTNKSGFYIDTATSVAVTTDNFINPTGGVFYEMVNLRGALFVSTFLPNQGQCAVGGHGFVQALNFRTGGGFIIDYNKDAAHPFYNGGIPDVNGDSSRNSSDVTAGVSSGKVLPALDVKVESINLASLTPYTFSNTLTASDIRLASSGGGILPAVASLGDQGAPVAPSILKGAQRVIVQPAYPVPTTTGNPASGDGGASSGNPASSTIPPPEMLPITIYNLPLDLVSFHEVTE